MAILFAVSYLDKEKEKDDEKATTPRPKRKFGLSSVTVDAKSLMKEGKKGASSTGGSRKVGSEAATPRKGDDSDSDTGEVSARKYTSQGETKQLMFQSFNQHISQSKDKQTNKTTTTNEKVPLNQSHFFAIGI